jgi:hypothetical protein
VQGPTANRGPALAESGVYEELGDDRRRDVQSQRLEQDAEHRIPFGLRTRANSSKGAFVRLLRSRVACSRSGSRTTLVQRQASRDSYSERKPLAR